MVAMLDYMIMRHGQRVRAEGLLDNHRKGAKAISMQNMLCLADALGLGPFGVKV